ncbi:hypothetical protein PPL_07481 [Heterostelium album PN500]|uniref:Uncharacterized protein n=1 Tax=Heterostelium pallidum (strain ATCC 26659 / Pp 5 / PN500) TaxID=670386 RepID=D3BG30_HETP5|nr:hypothetical protein PPL_07481 [Heterostelium album PN500]EFA79622.1 hypothetical protein PPL_07481 [Heterostelium album PN500]|eukprot:XP_020431743.1 hypothetical protein PPL_07481 [Heterostelium album PN500]
MFGDDSLRSQCVKFFVDYHRYKYVHYFDVQGYIKFIVDVFFDPELDVVENMSSFYCKDIPTITDIYNYMIMDKRVTKNINSKTLMIINILIYLTKKLKADQLKKRMKIYTPCFRNGLDDYIYNNETTHACQDDEDQDVYQYLLDHICSMNIKLDDRDSDDDDGDYYDSEDEEDEEEEEEEEE